jgi:ADP-heptose:LPS heptosyltransferase
MGQPLPEFDVHCPLLTLPLVFGTELNSIPAKVPYIFAHRPDAQSWKTLLGEKTDRARVGLIWAGRPTQRHTRNRAINISHLAPLAAAKNVEFFSLQLGEPARQKPPDGLQLIDHTSKLTDFAETAALIENLDLVLSIDTSVAHLAGAMGKPTWVLLPFIADFRWLLERDDSPWYPTMRLFRQTSIGDWTSAIEKLGSELRKL